MTAAILHAQPAAISAFLRLFWRQGDVREARIPKYNRYGHTAAGWFDNPDKLAQAVCGWDGKANVYITLNPVSMALLGHGNNRIKDRVESTTADKHVRQRTVLLIDIDPPREDDVTGISSTNAELAAARGVLEAVRDDLRQRGWPEPVCAMSGNGYYLLFGIDLPNDPESTALVKRVLEALAARHNTTAAHIDTSVHNAARIVGLVGTLKVKGDPLPDRPHRRSCVVSTPATLAPVSRAQLRTVADLAPEPAPNPHRRARATPGSAPPLVELLSVSGIAYREQPPDANGVTWYHLQRCPFHEDGPPFECGVGQQLPDGAYAGHCFHNRGAGKTWHEFKEALDLPVFGSRNGHTPAAPDLAQGPAPVPPDSGAMIPAIATAVLREHAFAQDPGGRLWQYHAGAYRPHGEAVIQQAVKAYLLAAGLEGWWRPERATAVVEYIRVDAPTLWERPPDGTVNLLNGLLDTRTMVFRPHTPGQLSPVQFPVRYDPTASCPAWEEFIEQTFPDDARDLAWEIAAFLIDCDPSLQKAVLLNGEGSNGKSAFLAGLTAFVGKANTAAMSLHKLESDRFAVARLVGKIANISADLPSDDLTSTAVFKAITGGDAVPAEYKYRDAFEFTPFCRLLFSANHYPRSADASYAFFRRWVPVPFNRTFEGAAARPRAELDATLADPHELSGVLNKALAVLPNLRTRGFSEPESVRQAWTEFRGTTDPLAIWLDEATISTPQGFVPKDTLRAAYHAVCDRKGLPGPSEKSFTQQLQRLRPSVREAQRSISGRVTRVWFGLGLYEAEDSPNSRVSRVSRVSIIVDSGGSEGGEKRTTVEKTRECRETREEDASAHRPPAMPTATAPPCHWCKQPAPVGGQYGPRWVGPECAWREDGGDG